MHIQMYHTSSWACSPYLCAQNFKWSLSFVISLPLCQVLLLLSFHHLSTLIYLLSFSPCTNVFVISPPITYIFVSLPFHYLCALFLPLCHQWPQRFKTRDSTTCRVEIINVNQWGEDHFDFQIWSNLDHLPKIFNSVWSKDNFFTPPNKGYLVPCWVKHL